MTSVFDHIKELQQKAIGDNRFQSFEFENYDFIALYEQKVVRPLSLNTSGFQGGVYHDCGPVVRDNSILTHLGTAYWNWRDQSQELVGFEVSAESAHYSSEVLGHDVLEEIDAQLSHIPWLEIRNGQCCHGRQVFAYLDEPIRITSRAQSSALWWEVLDLIIEETGYDFDEHITNNEDGCSWIYAFDASEEAYQVLKSASTALSPSELPLLLGVQEVIAC